MDCVKGALKTSFRPEIFVKQTHQAFTDDFLPSTGPTVVSGDDFFVDELLDFSKAGMEEEEEEEEEEEKDNNFSYFSVALAQKTEHITSNFSVPESELCVPADDLADLEWLSHFVDDSFSGYPLSFPVGKSSDKPPAKRSEPEFPVLEKPKFVTPVQTKARSKRARTGGRVWSFSLTESATSSSSSSCTTSSSSPPLNTRLIYNDPTLTAESLVGEVPVRKQKRRTAAEAGSQPRRCSHCLVQKTPQWRAGPLGAKTLCNACGVRYKSGRLLPEYRPACSPTFSSQVHSNNHRKVLEMRQKKEGDTGLVQPVQSF